MSSGAKRRRMKRMTCMKRKRFSVPLPQRKVDVLLAKGLAEPDPRGGFRLSSEGQRLFHEALQEMARNEGALQKGTA